MIRIAASIVAIFWAIFQLTLPQFVLLDRITIRAIHLAFAIVLIFLAFPPKRKRGEDRFCAHQSLKMRAFNLALTVIGLVSILYIVIDWNGIAAGLFIIQNSPLFS